MPTKHRGERLSAYLRGNDISYSQVAREIGRHRNTIDNWINKPALAQENIAEIVKVHPGLAASYPELNFDHILLVEDPPEAYTNINDLSEDCKKRIEHYRAKLDALQDKYNMVMEKYMILLEAQSGS